MSEVTMDSASLHAFEQALESFINGINSACNEMESGMSSCASFMRDEKSQEAFNKCRAGIERIKECVNPAQATLERVRDLESTLSEEPEM